MQKNRYFNISLTPKEVSDSGLAAMLILALTAYFTNNVLFYRALIPGLLILMIYPRTYYIFALIWMALARILGSFIPKVLLSIVFIIIIFPVAMVRKIAGKDSLHLNEFKRSNASVFQTRSHRFEANELEKPF